MQTPLILKGKVLHPAITEPGVAEAAQLAKARTFYETLLAETKHPYRLLTDMALQCEATADGSTHALIYWEVPGDSADLKKVYEDQRENHGCGGVHPPHKPPQPLLPNAKGGLGLATPADAAGSALGL